MTGREKIAAAFSSAGSPEAPVVSCYGGIFERDHFSALTDLPWWQQDDPDPALRAMLTADLLAKTDFDWFGLPYGALREEQQAIRIIHEPDGVYRMDARTGARRLLAPPVVSGTLSVSRDAAPVIDDLDAYLIEQITVAPPCRGVADGREELPRRLMTSLGQTKSAIRHVSAPLWTLGGLLGYEQWFAFLATDPTPLLAACERMLTHMVHAVEDAAACGCDVIWIEDCMTDQIGPARFARFNLPLLRELTDAIRRHGMHSVHYFCGDPWPQFDLLLDTGADALGLEESKKDFAIDIDAVADRVQGKMTLLGNLDAIDLLEHGSRDELRVAIHRQLAAGRRNGGRFILSTGSPITPGTSVARVREMVEMARYES